ncbi:MAG: hypothetical protein JWN03_6084 [Nocardia sp.]|uniref:nSTAND1 domain-containing NTPase n=1 Tax=Nocardia sp. TaxID=1821 RepID=UPI00262E13D9|nr:hypothetical protein [Nocardia sp.]MCU1645809.1 hypothetical protein [Nocardia sp.]
MVTGETEERNRSPRALFTQRFTELYEAAGNPTLRRVATAAETRMRGAQGNRPGGASAQRISDWKAGRNVPARFESLLPVVLTLVELARKGGHPLPRELAETREWQRLWHAATTWNPDEDDHAACPYPGLTSYRPENRTLFFGRTRATTELTALVRAATGLVAVIGASGAGKSSLLGAGLLPTLTDWETTALTPGAHPLTALLEAVTGNVPASQATADPHPVPGAGTGTTLKSAAASNPQDAPKSPTRTGSGYGIGSESDSAPEDPGTASTAIQVATVRAALTPRSDRPRRLLIIDQFEELFTACDSEQEREEFLTVLNGCAGRADDPIAVVVALRADFYAHCLNYLVLQDALEHRSYLLGPMRPDELAQAISGPARAVGLELEPGLEELVITELCGAGDHHGRRTYDPGALPLLSHVMAATWQHREGRRLTVNGYRNAGGVVGSVAETAEYAWNELSSTQREAAKSILLGLVTVTQDSRDTRRIAQRSELLRRVTNPEDATAALELLSRTRLITLDSDAVTLTHEIVLTAWPRLRAWIDEDRVGYLTRQRLETDAAEWAAQERDSSLLYRGTRLHNALDNVDPPPVGPLAREFLTAATTAQKKTRRRSRYRRINLVFLAVVLLITASGLYYQNRLADQRRNDKDFAAVLTAADQAQQTDPSLAAQLNLIAWRMHPGDSAVRSRLWQTEASPLVTTTAAHSQAVKRILYQPGGKVLASLSENDGSLRLWDNTDSRHPRALGQQISGISEIALSSQSPLMVTTNMRDAPDHAVTLWDISAPATPRRLTTMPGLTDAQDAWVAFTPDGRTLAALTLTRLTLWNVSNPAAPILTSSKQVRDEHASGMIGPIGFSPNGKLLGRINNNGDTMSNTAELWDVADPADPTLVTPSVSGTNAGPLIAFAFSPDGTVLAVGADYNGSATGGTNSNVQLWDIADPLHARLLSTLSTDRLSLSTMEFSPNGDLLATSGSRGPTLWNVTDPAAPIRSIDKMTMSPTLCHLDSLTTPCSGGPTTFDFAPDGRAVAAGGLSGDIQIWSLPPAVLTGRTGWAAPPIIAANGARMATNSGDGRIALWDIRNPQIPKRIGEYRADTAYEWAQLSADGNTLLVLDYLHGAVQTLDASDAAHIRQRGEWRIPTSIAPAGMTFSADLRLMATTSGNMVQLWDFSNTVQPKAVGDRFPMPEGHSMPLFGPDGSTLIVLSTTETAAHREFSMTLWNIADPAQPQRISELVRQPASEIDTGALTPDHKTMITTSNELIQAWDIGNPAKPVRLGAPFTANTLPIQPVGFTADSRTLVTVGVDGTLQEWDLTDRAHPANIGTLVQSDAYAWNAALAPDGRHVASSSRDGTVHLWDLDEQHAIDRICTVTGAMWSPELWQRYLPQLPYQPPCN